MVLLLVAWLSILWLVVKLLGPVIADFLSAQLSEFEKKNPRYKGSVEQGLALLKDLGLRVVADVSGFKFPENMSEAQRDDTMRAEGERQLAALAARYGLNVGTNDVRRTIEEAVTAFKQGMRSRGLE